MKNSDINDPLFRKAVEAIDTGNEELFERLLSENPSLVSKQLSMPVEGYFSRPYLLWFVADNPIRVEKLPANIVVITEMIIDFVKAHSRETLQHQLDYTLGLVATGRVPRECNVQIEMMELLISNGAAIGSTIGVLAHGNLEAAEYLINKGSPLTLTVAVCLGWNERISDLFEISDTKERELALVAAAFFGKKELVEFFITRGVNVNGFPDPTSGFHSHATALHQAVYSGSLDSVELLVAAGADLTAQDKVYAGTPLGWAQYAQTGSDAKDKKQQYLKIEKFLLANQ